MRPWNSRSAALGEARPASGGGAWRLAAGAFLLALAVDCSDSPAPPAPAPAPPALAPEAPGQVTGIEVEVGTDFLRWSWPRVEGATGYQGHAFPEGTPQSERGALESFEEPTFLAEGLEPSTAWGFYVRAVRETAGGRAVGPWSRGYGNTWGEPRVCTDERRLAENFRGERGVLLLKEWDGTPFRFYFDEGGVPEKDRAEAEYILAELDRVFGEIEAQIGFPVVEVGGWAKFDSDWTSPSSVARDCESWRPRGTIISGVTQGGPEGYALMECPLSVWGNGEVDSRNGNNVFVTVHEVFHLFGFKHSPESTHPQQHPPGVGYPMSVQLTNVPRPPPHSGLTFADVDALRCILERSGD